MTKAEPTIAVVPSSARAALVFEAEQFKQFANLAEAFYYNAGANPDVIAYDKPLRDECDARGRRKYFSRTHAESRKRVLQIASALCKLGVAKGDAVAILSLDRPEWTEAEMAVYTVGAHVVPCYVRDTKERLRHILSDAGVKFAFAENEQQLEKLLHVAEHDLPGALRHVVTFESARIASRADCGVTALATLLSTAAVTLSEGSFADCQSTRDDIACIYYTSGSSGDPKGVPVTHGQILANLYQIATAGLVDAERFDENSGEQPMVTFLLPERAHAYPSRSAQLVACSPARARYTATVDTRASDINDAFRKSIQRDLREGGAGMIAVVPKIAMSIEQRVRERLAAGGWRERIAQWVIDRVVDKLLKDKSSEVDLGAQLGPVLRVLQRRVAQRVRPEVVGPDFDYFISGGAKLPLETAAFLFAIGLPIYEGYGSTETNCPIASNTPQYCRLGSAGKLFAEVEAKVDPATGELLVRGPNVARGYLHCPEESAANWDADGWYHTRDIAAIDADGFLAIEERLDHMLVLLNGENVSPVAIENCCLTMPGIEAAIVIGDHRPALVALVALSEETARGWLREEGHEFKQDWREDPVVLDRLRHEVERNVNRRAGHAYERIRAVAIIEPPSVERRTLTVTEKLKRKEIERRYADVIKAMYANHDDWITPEPSVLANTRRVAAL